MLASIFNHNRKRNMNEEIIWPSLIQELALESEVPNDEIHRHTKLENDLGLSDESLESILVSVQGLLPGSPDLSSISSVWECGTVEGLLDAIVDVVLS